jgi:hypothetical protein
LPRAIPAIAVAPIPLRNDRRENALGPLDPKTPWGQQCGWNSPTRGGFLLFMMKSSL